MALEIPHNAAAARAVRFINGLTHAKGPAARQPFNLREWQENQIIRPLFGTLRPDGLRQYRTAFIFLPRRNGKTETAAAIALYFLLSEPEHGGEIYSAAVDREQASLVFRVAAQMVKNDPQLSRACRIIDSQRTIIYQATNSTYRAIPADAPHAHGYNASCVIYDELHAAPNRNLWDVLTTSMGSREQPLTVGITTAGFDRESLCYQLYNYASKVRDGIIEDQTFLPVIFEAPQDADWTDEKVWHDANPALGDYRSMDEMRQMFREAQQVPARENVFRQLYLNQWTDSATRWISTEVWEACGQERIDPEELRGRECFAGLDLAYRDDFAALVLAFPNADQSYTLVPHLWIPEDGKRDLRTAPYVGWVKQGLVNVSPGNSTDFGAIRTRINELGQQYHIKRIAADPWNARQLSSELLEDGFEVVEFKQSMLNFNEPTKQFEVLAKAGHLRHGNHAVLRWMMSNVVVEHDSSGNYRPSKKKSSEKIDGIVAAIMALAQAMSQVESESWYTPGCLRD